MMRLSNEELSRLGREMYLGGCTVEEIGVCLGSLLADISVKQFLSDWSRAIDQWRSHPDYDWYHTDTEETSDQYLMAGVFTHEPGANKMMESYIICGLSELLRQVNWGERTLGNFQGVCPLPEFVNIRFPKIRQCAGFVSYSFKGSGRAFNSRLILKKLLPTKFSRFITLARKNNAQKLDRGRINPDTGETIHNFRTKREKFIHQASYLYPDLRDLIEKYMALDDFYDCAIGKHNPHDVHKYVNHQLEFPIFSNAVILWSTL